MRRRLDLAASIIVPADLFFLDEPTAGLDPASRAQVWEIIHAIVAGGATVLLTTQYLDEADELADRIDVIGQGTVIAEDTTGELKAPTGSGTLRIRLADPARRPAVQMSITATEASDTGIRPRVPGPPGAGASSPLAAFSGG